VGERRADRRGGADVDGEGVPGGGPTCGECGNKGLVDHKPECSQPNDWKPGDEKLIRYLYENQHATPFEMAGMVIEVKAPIMVFREWHRHRTQSYNEMSARYIPLPDENYVPSVERLLINSKTNKQAGTVAGAAELTAERAELFREDLVKIYYHQQCLYESALAIGVPKELARVHLPVGRYSRMRASANLRNWLAFLTLRMASGAQWEIRQYANAVGDLVREAFPRTWDLFAERRPR
jgi:thymidylate synthase (FAD)